MGAVIPAKTDYLSAHYNLGVALDDRGKLEEAIAAWRKQSGSNPTTQRLITTSASLCRPIEARGGGRRISHGDQAQARRRRRQL